MKELLLTPKLFKPRNRRPVITGSMVFYRPGRAMLWAFALIMIWTVFLSVYLVWDMLVLTGAGFWALGKFIRQNLKRTETA